MAKIKGGGKGRISADYYPGCISIPNADYNFLLADSVEEVYLTLSYSEFCKEKRVDHSYQIDIANIWLRSYFYVISIYNTDKSKYKKMFDPLQGKNYKYESKYPGGSITRVRKFKVDDCR